MNWSIVHIQISWNVSILWTNLSTISVAFACYCCFPVDWGQKQFINLWLCLYIARSLLIGLLSMLNVLGNWSIPWGQFIVQSFFSVRFSGGLKWILLLSWIGPWMTCMLWHCMPLFNKHFSVPVSQLRGLHLLVSSHSNAENKKWTFRFNQHDGSEMLWCCFTRLLR